MADVNGQDPTDDGGSVYWADAVSEGIDVAGKAAATAIALDKQAASPVHQILPPGYSINPGGVATYSPLRTSLGLWIIVGVVAFLLLSKS